MILLEEKNKGLLILSLSISIFIIVHLLYINLPPCSVHVWRQCNTLAVAQNFYDESFNILEPRVDRRFEGDGITGTAFPLYEWIVAMIYKITGVHYWVHRSFSLVLSIIAIVFSYCFLSNISTNKTLCAISSSLLLWCPELFYHSINAIPDIMALCTGFISLYLITKPSKGKLSIFTSYFFLMISGLIKVQYLMIGVFHIIELINNFRNNRKWNEVILYRFIPGIFSLVIVLGWYKYSVGLIEKSNLRDFGIEIRSADTINDAIHTLKKNIVSDFPELVLGFANFILVIIGLIIGLKKRNANYYFSFLFLAGLYLTYHILELRQMQVHHYYMLPSYFFMLALIYQGVHFLYQKKLTTLVVLFLFIQPTLACIRIIPARWGKTDLGITTSFSDSEKLNELKKRIPPNAKVIAGPDESGCIYLYFLHKKGFGYEYPNQLAEIKNGKTVIEDYIQRGASYLITTNQDDLSNVQLKEYFQSTIQYNEFYIIQLKK